WSLNYTNVIAGAVTRSFTGHFRFVHNRFDMANQNKKIALVTGAGSGIGRASALALQAANFTVVLAGRRLTELEGTAAKAAASGGDMLPVATDVSNPESVKALFGRIAKEYGRIDVVFNNAGINVPAIPMDELSFEQWSSVVGINLTGSFLCAQEAMRMMKAQNP